MNFDETLQEIGEFGRHQKWIYFLLGFPCASVGSFCFMVVVVLFTPDHRCKIPFLENDTFALQDFGHEYLVNHTIPVAEDTDIGYDRCHLYVDINETLDSNNRPINATKTKCNEWVYDKRVFLETFTSKMDLVCDDSLKTSHIMMCYYFGVLLGDFLLGVMSDVFGRKKALILSFVVLITSSIAATFAPEFYSFATLQLIIGGCAHGGFVTIAVFSMEMVGPSKRIWTGMLIQIFFALGVCYLALIAFLTRNWTWVNLSVGLPCVAYLTYWWFIPESARWLLSNKRKAEALAIIRKVAKVNKAQLPKQWMDINESLQQSSGKLWHVLASPVLLRRTLILCLNWMAVSMTYYGVTMNIGNLGGNFFINFFLMGLAEIPGVMFGIAILDRVGRRWSNAGSMIIGGIACLAIIPTVLFGGQALHPLTITLAFIGKAGASAAFAIIYMFTAELLPTAVRNAAMGSCSSAARVGAMLAPYIAKSGEMIGGKFGDVEPLLVFGTLSITASIFLLFLPETHNQKLPDSIQEGEEFGRGIQRNVEEIEIPFINTETNEIISVNVTHQR